METAADLSVRDVLARQYRAGLEMLREAVAVCPESLWAAPEYPNRFWHIAYHALFYTHLYLQAGEAEFHAWTKHKQNYNFLGPLPWPPHERLVIATPYSKQEILDYQRICRKEIDAKVPSLDLAAASGFSWIPFSKLELQLYSIRHLQHHTGQLADRLRTAAGIGLKWVPAV
ncbi:MAG TPA: DinB family protein [Bryobacteraceae bacterium]|nr:DinB family protein [Bryobacteraceae bacterium]